MLVNFYIDDWVLFVSGSGLFVTSGKSSKKKKGFNKGNNTGLSVGNDTDRSGIGNTLKKTNYSCKEQGHFRANYLEGRTSPKLQHLRRTERELQFRRKLSISQFC